MISFTYIYYTIHFTKEFLSDKCTNLKLSFSKLHDALILAFLIDPSYV